MTPAARVAAAIGILDDWRQGAPVERLLTNWARGARYAGSKDRAAVRDLVYDALRRAGSAAHAGGGPDGRALMLGLARLTGADAGALFSGAVHGPAALDPRERALLAEGPSPDDPALDIPDWLRVPVARRAADDAAAQALFSALSGRAPVWLRVALRRGSREAAAAALAGDGIETRADARCTTALEVLSGARTLRSARAYLDGLVELQDLSAQRAVAFVDWPASGTVLDYCAGGGGKALAIADRTAATVLAHDIAARRMADLPARADRAGVRIGLIAPGRGADAGPCEAVLCDVPCSGSGTWRRDPEAKWRLTPEGLDALVARQAEILAEAAELVAPGGRLVYMTCSLLPAENEDQVARFRDLGAGWRLLSERVDTPLTASDGFYCAVLERAV